MNWHLTGIVNIHFGQETNISTLELSVEPQKRNVFSKIFIFSSDYAHTSQKQVYVILTPLNPSLMIRSIVSNASVTDSEGPDQTARNRRLVWAFVSAYARRHVFAWLGQDKDSSVTVLHRSCVDGLISSITKARLYNFDPLKPRFYIVKLRFTGVYIIVLISAQKHRLWVLVRTASSRRF